MDDIQQLKSVLRSLVVSSPAQMTLSMLMRDYRNMMGSHLPIHKYGYRDALQFLKERCGDCFLFQGIGSNTVLIPIVPECLKHIDEFVHKQKVSAKIKFIGKRRSVHESVINPAPNLIAKTFELSSRSRPETQTPVIERPASRSRPETQTPVRERPAPTPLKNGPQSVQYENTKQPDKKVQPQANISTNVDNSNNKYNSTTNHNGHNKENTQQENVLPSMEAYKNFLRKRLPIYESCQDLYNENKTNKDSDSGKFSESEQRTSSSSSSIKATQLEELKAELLRLVAASPDGVCCTDLMKLYRQRYGRELNFSRFGFTSVSALACSLAGVHAERGADGNVRVAAAPPAAAPRRALPRRALPRRALPRRLAPAPRAPDCAPHEDALPWIDFDPDVFPADCLSFSESIPAVSLAHVRAGAMLEVMLGEVYSPSHFWLYRLGADYHIAMEDMMDEMTLYYSGGAGAARALAAGAVRAGHYCSSMYERDWHRSLIVQVVDSDTVKVRHVDYGTVDRVCARALKPLLRRWGALPAQAVRARLAGVCPAARGRRWPHAAAAAFLRLVQDRRLVANVVHVDTEENIVEVFLVDTSTERDVRIDEELIRAGHADPRAAPHHSALAASYLYPRFDALETGATPNFADIHAYLRDGIALQYVEDYSRHVPAEQPAPPPAPRLLDNRVPLIPRSLLDGQSASVSPVERTDLYNLQSSTELEGEECPVAETSVYSQSHDSSADEYESVEPGKGPHEDSASKDCGQELPAERTCAESPPPLVRVGPQGACAAPAPAPVEAPKLARVAPEAKPAYRATPRVSPSRRPMCMSSQMLAPPFFGLPSFPAPSTPPIFFRVPSFPMHPSFSPRPYPAMEGYLAPPQQCFQPQMRSPYSGPAYSSSQPFFSGPVYSPMYDSCPSPCSHPRAPTPDAPGVTSTPITKAPAIAEPVSITPVSKLPLLTTSVSKLTVSTASLPERSADAPPLTAPAPPPGAGPQPPPYQGGPRRITTGHGDVTLSVSECEIFSLLSSVDPNAAHWYMVDAISRAMATRSTPAARAPLCSASRLNPEASEFLLPPPGLRPPPGFASD